jgi:hypothetical protein
LLFASLSFQNDEILPLDAVVPGKGGFYRVLENAFPMTIARYEPLGGPVPEIPGCSAPY